MVTAGTSWSAMESPGLDFDAAQPPVERRAACRHRTVYRLVKLKREDRISLCQLCNISDEGLMLAHVDPMEVGEHLTIELSDDQSVEGRVVWADADHCGITLDAAIDSEALLHDLAEERRSSAYRPPRLDVSLLGVAYSELGLHPVRTTDLSQKGMGLSHDGRLHPELKLLVMLENGIERRGVVRWSHDHRAGLMLTEPLGCTDLNRCVSGRREIGRS